MNAKRFVTTNIECEIIFFNSKEREEKKNSKTSKCLQSIISKKKSEYFGIVHKQEISNLIIRTNIGIFF